MAEQFHEGQEVEVYIVTQAPRPIYRPSYEWRKAKIIGWSEHAAKGSIPNGYEVRFPDGTRNVFDAEHIRDRFPLDNHQMQFGSSPIGK